MKEFITVITPTYNREKNLQKLYDSLTSQTNSNFIWLVVDDGSTDNTEKVMKDFKKDNKIKITYIKKKNGGKHTALNIAFDSINTDLFFVVDSDDYLTNDAIETIFSYFKKYEDKSLAGFVFLRGYSENKSVSVKFEKDEFIGNYVKDIINKQPSGDRVEVFFSKYLFNNRFPEFENEKFIGEGFFWNKISKKHDMLFVNKIIYICEYIDGGLTKSGRKMRIKYPLSGMEHAKEYLNKEYSMKLRIKNMILYQVYYRIANKNHIKSEKLPFSILKMICFVPSLFIYYYWTLKYN